jgi:hypothetical protein
VQGGEEQRRKTMHVMRQDVLGEKHVGHPKSLHVMIVIRKTSRRSMKRIDEIPDLIVVERQWAKVARKLVPDPRQLRKIVKLIGRNQIQRTS